MGMMATRFGAAAVLAVLVGCSPVEDWRQVRLADSAALALFPCKPASQTRSVPLAGDAVSMTLHACSAGANTFAVAHADVVDPARVTPALRALAEAAAANVGAPVLTGEPWRVDGMTPNPEARRLRLQGRLPDGTAVNEEAVTFTRGTFVFQATVLGAAPPAESVATFFEGLKLPS
jgi:hypothetical protein